MNDRFVAGLIACFAGIQTAHAEVVLETIFFVNADGRSYERYAGSRTDYGSYNIFLDKGATLDGYLYFYPNAFQWDRTSDSANDIIRINQGDYSFIEQGKFDAEIEVAENGDLIYATSRDDPAGERYGYWNTPVNFSKFVYAWVLPKNLEVIDAKSNREGEWVRRNNAIAWFGADVNNVAFEMRYRLKSAGAYERLRDAVSGAEGVSVEQADDGVRLTLADTILFASGSAALTTQGLEVVRQLTKAISFANGLSVVVEGHTDNAPIRGALTETFATNWELSAARSLAVVRAMEADGAPGPQLEARAFGEHHPVADNGTAQGRLQNRRIVILVTESGN